jgi:hypothetical protein
MYSGSTDTGEREHTDIAAVLVAVLVVAIGPLSTPGEWYYLNTIIAGVVLVVLIPYVWSGFRQATVLKRVALTVVFWGILTVFAGWPVQRYWVYPHLHAAERPPPEGTWTYCNSGVPSPNRMRPDGVACNEPVLDPYTAKAREDQQLNELGGQANPKAAAIAAVMACIVLAASYVPKLRKWWVKRRVKVTRT